MSCTLIHVHDVLPDYNYVKQKYTCRTYYTNFLSNAFLSVCGTVKHVFIQERYNPMYIQDLNTKQGILTRNFV